MRILCTFPGKHGDSLWAMPTVRALSEAAGEPVDLLMAPAYAGLLPLYRQQPYIGRAEGWPTWQVQNTAPMTPWSPFEETLHHEALGIDPAAYDHVLHLGYREWPDRPLPYYVESIVRREYPQVDFSPLDLDRPWLQPPPPHYGAHFPASVTVGFTDEHFELKYGIYMLLTRHVVDLEGGWQSMCGTPGSRWQTEARHGLTSWETAAGRIAGSQLFLGCCSALHVLACGLGVPVVLMEPNPHRHHVNFYPYGTEGPRVTLVRGNDGLPTFDARHVLDAIRAGLARGRT